MGVIRLERRLFLLWATPPGDTVAFEVSKVIGHPLQERCSTAPLCPSEVARAARAEGHAPGGAFGTTTSGCGRGRGKIISLSIPRSTASPAPTPSSSSASYSSLSSSASPSSSPPARPSGRRLPPLTFPLAASATAVEAEPESSRSVGVSPPPPVHADDDGDPENAAGDEAEPAEEAGDEIDLDGLADAGCPYGFCTKSECIRERNTEALSSALFRADEVDRTANFLRALGYGVRLEPVPEEAIDGTRILIAHGRICNFHDVRLLSAPKGRELVLVRNPYAPTSGGQDGRS